MAPEERTLDAYRREHVRSVALVLFGLSGMFALANCAGESSAARTERSIAAGCTAWEERAKKAAHPDAEMIAQHDRLMAQAARYAAEAQAKWKDKAGSQTAIENQVQAETDAAAIYDWRYDLRVAADCWQGLNVAQEIHREQRERLSRLADDLATSAPPQSFAPSASLYTLHTQPPSAPGPNPVPNLGTGYVPPSTPLPKAPAQPGPFLGRVPGGPDVYGVPADQVGH